MSRQFLIQPGGKLQGEVTIPGDKSISHRAVMIAAVAEGSSTITGFLEGEDTLATLRAFESMGVKIEQSAKGEVIVHGVGLHGLKAPNSNIDLGNSGTSMRLLTGLLASQSFDLELGGDESLSTRPMRRVIDPLNQMGAKIDCESDGTPPIRISADQKLKGITYDLPVASAQIKSALLLAGLYAKGETQVNEIGILRDHTERMLESFGWPVEYGQGFAKLSGQRHLKAQSIMVPGDISSAAFFIVAASIAEGSDLTLKNVGINPSRDGVIRILKLMGADIQILNQSMAGGEPVADLRIRSAQLKGITIPEQFVPLAIDEFPAIFIAAACAEGHTTLRGAAEMRVKESDRIKVMHEGLLSLGIDAKELHDGMSIQGGQFSSCAEQPPIHSHGDHRISMAFAMAGLRSEGVIQIKDCDNVDTSFPSFVDIAKSVGLDIRLENV